MYIYIYNVNLVPLKPLVIKYTNVGPGFFLTSFIMCVSFKTLRSEILGPPKFSKFKKDINVNIAIVNPPPEIEIANFFKSRKSKGMYRESKEKVRGKKGTVKEK